MSNSNDNATPAPSPAKPGYKTTEFWLTALATVGGLLMASGAVVDGGLAAQIIGGIVAALAGLGYTGARTSVKKQSNGNPPAGS